MLSLYVRMDIFDEWDEEIFFFLSHERLNVTEHDR